MPWRQPAYPGEFPSLGWGVIQWCEAYLRVPDGDLRGQPWVFTPDQKTFIVNLFRVQQPYGLDLQYRRAARIKPKGTGKSPTGAALALAFAGAPVVPDGYSAAGEPVGRPQATPVIQIAGVSEDQADNVYSLVVQMCELGDLDDAIPGINPGATKVMLPDGGTIMPVSSSSGSREGQRVTAAILEETQHWRQSNGGQRLAGVLRRNVAKMSGLTIELSNAPEPGAGSVCENTIVGYRKGEREGILLDYQEPSFVVDFNDDDSVRKALREVYGDTARERGGWVNLDRIFRDLRDTSTDPSDAQRYYLNIMAAGAGAWIDVAAWQECKDANRYLVDNKPPAGTKITMGFDGSRTGDSTVLRGCTLDGFLFTLGIWERPRNLQPTDRWEVPQQEVQAAIGIAMAKYNVIRFYADPPHWRDEVDGWSGKWPEAVAAWETNRDTPMAAALERLHTAITQHAVTHDDDSAVALHYGNAYRKVKGSADKPLVLIKKESPDSMRKIDAVMADALAYEACWDAIADGIPEDKPADYYTMYAL